MEGFVQLAIPLLSPMIFEGLALLGGGIIDVMYVQGDAEGRTGRFCLILGTVREGSGPVVHVDGFDYATLSSGKPM